MAKCSISMAGKMNAPNEGHWVSADHSESPRVYSGSDRLLNAVHVVKSGDKTRPLGESFQNCLKGDLENLMYHTQFTDHHVIKHLKELSSLKNELLYFIKSVPHFLIFSVATSSHH